jgi:Icc-related predicted phosphoesterase
MNWDEDALQYSALSRCRISTLSEGVRPELHLHGHLHVADTVELPGGQRIVSLGRDGQRRNIGLLDVPSLAWSWID